VREDDCAQVSAALGEKRLDDARRGLPSQAGAQKRGADSVQLRWMDDLPLLRRLRPSWGWSIGLVVLNICAAPWIVAPGTAKSIGASIGRGPWSVIPPAGLGPFSDYDRGLAILFVVLALAEMFFLLQLARPRWIKPVMRDLAVVPDSQELRRAILYPRGLLAQIVVTCANLAVVLLIPSIRHGPVLLGYAVFVLALSLPFIYIPHRMRVTGWWPTETAYQPLGEVPWICQTILGLTIFLNLWVFLVVFVFDIVLTIVGVSLRRHRDRSREPWPKLRW
jgi:hypothetical protein